MLDISNINSPKLVWRISPQTTGFSELGQTWSKPALAKMRVANPKPENATHDSELIDVLVFGGGYDPVKNTENTADVTRAADGKGRNVYIVRADNGELIWSLRDNVAGAAAKLTDSIPGDIRVLDMDRNGALDRLYFSDTGGRVWRVDMDVDVKDLLPAGADTFYNYSKARLSEFANVGGSGLNKRMFFYEPDVALMQHRGKTILTLAIGSGYRTRPLSPSDDRFYVFIDRNPFNDPDTSIFPIQEDAKLVSLTNADGTDNTSAIGASKSLLTETTLNGWYYDLPNTGEKVLAPAVTFMNKVIFTTFASAPATEEGIDPCSSPPNSARAYVLDLFNGGAVVDLDRKDGDAERSIIAGINEILDAAQVVFSKPTAADGTACKAGDCGTQVAEVRIGKMNLPLIDNTNVPVGTDLGDILPRVFWRDELRGE
jgi:Tfp pilus tip-associated adhesin PilY1